MWDSLTERIAKIVFGCFNIFQPSRAFGSLWALVGVAPVQLSNWKYSIKTSSSEVIKPSIFMCIQLYYLNICFQMIPLAWDFCQETIGNRESKRFSG